MAVEIGKSSSLSYPSGIGSWEGSIQSLPVEATSFVE